MILPLLMTHLLLTGLLLETSLHSISITIGVLLTSSIQRRLPSLQNSCSMSFHFKPTLSKEDLMSTLLISNALFATANKNLGSIYGRAPVLLLTSPHSVIVLNLPCYNTLVIRCHHFLPLSSTPGTAYPVGLFHHPLLLLPPLPSIFSSEVSFLHLSLISFAPLST